MSKKDMFPRFSGLDMSGITSTGRKIDPTYRDLPQARAIVRRGSILPITFFIIKKSFVNLALSYDINFVRFTAVV